jgi:hypothetical protein
MEIFEMLGAVGWIDEVGREIVALGGPAAIA